MIIVRFNSDAEIIEIPVGYSPQQIGTLLKEHQIIDSIFWFKSRIKLGGHAPNLQAGIYSFNPGSSIGKVISKLVSGDVEEYEDVRITIPEGYTIPQVGQLLESKGLVLKDDFLQAIGDYQLSTEWAIGIPSQVLWRLEGYLFPDTYDFRSITTPESIVAKMAARFNEQIYNLYVESPLKDEYTLHELLTLASIVEKEAVLDEERPIIASVFYNRIKIGQPLQSCATVQYVLPVHREVLLTEDTKIESPYNTYKYLGLPPGPISSVGQASFKAVLEPADTNYYYFNAIGEGKHHFSKTYQEHLQAVSQNR